MSKEKQPQAKPSRDVVVATNNEFAVNLLETLWNIDPKRLLEVRAFFSEAFLLHTEDEIFDSSNYRSEWANNVNYIHDLCGCVDKYTEEQIDNAINHSVSCLKKESEANNA